MSIKQLLKKFWHIIWKDDSLKGWIISIIVIFIIVKFIFFPLLNFTTGTKLPLVVVESCSMYHPGDLLTDFDQWWAFNVLKYAEFDISKEEFTEYKIRDGFNKGDIILSLGTPAEKLERGDIIIFSPSSNALKSTPIIHRIVDVDNENLNFRTLGDNNAQSLTSSNNPYKIDETNIQPDQVIGRAVLRIPYLGWAKLVFFDWMKQSGERGFCKN